MNAYLQVGIVFCVVGVILILINALKKAFSLDRIMFLLAVLFGILCGIGAIVKKVKAAKTA